MRFFLVAVSMLCAPTAQAQGWRVTRLDVQVDVTPETRLLSVAGSVRIVPTETASSYLTLVFGPDGVTFDSAAASAPAAMHYSPNRDSLFLRLTSPASAGGELTVRFAGHTERDIGRNLVRPQGAMISWGARWYPILAASRDSAAIFEFPGETRITVPAGWRTLAPGALTDSVMSADRRTETWRVARPTARSFVAADFVPASTLVDGSVVRVYLLRRHASRMREFADAIPQMVTVLSRYFGPYPFSAFGIAELPHEVAPPGFGGRSEPGYFIAHTDALEGPLNVALFAHELAHMWFPNAVDSRPPGDDMMDEAIASYAVALYKEAIFGRDSARHELNEGNPDFSVRAYFHEMRRGADEPLMADYSPVIARAKGPIVYDMIRQRVGEEAFFGAWKDFAKAGGSISLNELRRELLRRVPQDTGLATFLSQWLDRAGAPIVEARRISPNRVAVEQRGPLYQLDIPVRIGSRDTMVRFAGARTEIVARERVSIDPHDDMLIWKPRFGPPPDAPISWPLDRFRRWLDDEARWLMHRYGVRAAALTVVRAGRVAWRERYGSVTAKPADGALVDSLRAHSDSTTWRRWIADAEDVTLYVGRPADGVGILVTVRGGWGGRQLAMHLAQRIAIQYQWSEIPR